MSNLNNIWNEPGELHAEELIRYLQGKATDEERFEIENLMADSEFISDAVEGLQNFKDPKQVREYVAELNKMLKNQTAKKTARKQKRKLGDQNWLVIAILAILFISIAGYLLIHFFSIKH
jgi:ribosomal protein S18